jgi:CRP/FNR family transcriptional regulator, transcriptional activator FtrB
MRDEDTVEIRQLALFREMAEENFAAMMRGTYLQTFPPRVTIIEEGDTADFLPVLIEGSVELYARWEGRQTTIELLSPVTTMVLAATISNRCYLMSGRTLSKSRIALVPSEDVRHAFDVDRAFAAAIVTELAMSFRGAVRHVKNLKLRNGAERLANLLLRESAAAGGATEFELPVEKRLLASLLGMTPENLSRAFAKLRRHGVEVDGARILLRSRAELQRVARPSDRIDFETT